jgi:hypothetical protein
MRWHHCQHHAVVVAGIALALSPLLCWRCHPCYICVAASIKTGICPVMTQVRHVAGEALFPRSSLLPVASSLYTALVHCNLAFDGLAKAVMAFSLALHWHPCLHRADIIASVELSLLPAMRRRCC